MIHLVSIKPLGRRERYRLLQLNDLMVAVLVDYLYRSQRHPRLVDEDIQRMHDEMVQTLCRDFKDIVLRIVGDPVQRGQFLVDLSTEPQPGGLDLDVPATKVARYAIEVRLPLSPLQSMGCHN